MWILIGIGGVGAYLFAAYKKGWSKGDPFSYWAVQQDTFLFDAPNGNYVATAPSGATLRQGNQPPVPDTANYSNWYYVQLLDGTNGTGWTNIAQADQAYIGQ